MQSDQNDPAFISRLLNQSAGGDRRASAELLPLVYEQLRRLARSKMRHERADQTLQATALVHEAFLRIAGSGDDQHWQGRWHFFAAAAEAMRRILVDNARRRARLKRGGGLRRTHLPELQLTLNAPAEELMALDEALSKLAQEHPEKADLVKLRYFAGLTNEEASQALGISTATAERRWAFARAWLYRQMSVT
jgi:RNA polymerase sigma factor (TIGR02999 family)